MKFSKAKSDSRRLSSLFKTEHPETQQFDQLVSEVNSEVITPVRLQMMERSSSLFSRNRNLGAGFRLHHDPIRGVWELLRGWIAGPEPAVAPSRTAVAAEILILAKAAGLLPGSPDSATPPDRRGTIVAGALIQAFQLKKSVFWPGTLAWPDTDRAVRQRCNGLEAIYLSQSKSYGPLAHVPRSTITIHAVGYGF
ncbi:MAG TPA: hypothetical protein VII95_17895 [Terriglobales bacterium]